MADILVVDDDPIMRDLVTDWLEAAGYRVRTAVDCASVMAQVERTVPALVVTDICMPGPNGAVVICNLKRDHPGIRVIAVSGQFNAGCGVSGEAALEFGADRALAKPVRRGDLLQAVAELVGPPDG